MKIIERVGWLAAAAVLGPVTNELAFYLLNPPGTGVSLARAAIPAIASAGVAAFCVVKAMGFLRKKNVTSNVERPDAAPQFPVTANFNRDTPQANVSNSDHTPADDETVWAEALKEFDGPDRRVGLWARLFAQASGNEAVAKAAYLKARAAELTARNAPPEAHPKDSSNVDSVAVLQGIEPKRPPPSPDADGTRAASVSPAQPAALAFLRVPVAIFFLLAAFVAVAVFVTTDGTDPPARMWWVTPDWSARVADLRKKLVAREIPEIPSLLSSQHPREGTVLPADVPHDLEAKQTWWKAKEMVFIHLQNTTPHTLAGIGIEFAERRCAEPGPVTRWFITPLTSIAPGQQAILSFRSNEITSGCLTITFAWG